MRWSKARVGHRRAKARYLIRTRKVIEGDNPRITREPASRELLPPAGAVQDPKKRLCGREARMRRPRGAIRKTISTQLVRDSLRIGKRESRPMLRCSTAAVVVRAHSCVTLPMGFDVQVLISAWLACCDTCFEDAKWRLAGKIVNKPKASKGGGAFCHAIVEH